MFTLRVRRAADAACLRVRPDPPDQLRPGSHDVDARGSDIEVSLQRSWGHVEEDMPLPE
jgi:hypothetical protein